jgi:hypothetical protein
MGIRWLKQQGQVGATPTVQPTGSNPKLNDRDLKQNSPNLRSQTPATKIAPEYKGTRKSYPQKLI